MRFATLTIGLLTVLAMARFAGAADATTGTLDGTDHDLRLRLGITQVCVPCHAPHNAIHPADGPIWNHALSTLTFSRTDWHGNTTTVQLSGSSKLCMGCHDGVTAVGSYGNLTGSGSGGPITGADAIGNNLSASHPVGVDYPTGSHTLESPADVASYLEDGKIQCGSCHRPHGNSTNSGHFLRVTLDGSQLCRTCHTF